MSGPNSITPASIIDKITDKVLEDKKRFAILEEEIQEFSLCLNRVASSPDGQFFLRKMIRYCGIHHDDDKIDPAKLIEDKGRRSVYLKLVRPYLDKSVLSELEKETA